MHYSAVSSFDRVSTKMERIFSFIVALSIWSCDVTARSVQGGFERKFGPQVDYDYPHEIHCDHNHDHKTWSHQRQWGFQMMPFPPKNKYPPNSPKNIEHNWNKFEDSSEEQPHNVRRGGNNWNNWMYPGQNQFTTRFPTPGQWQSRPTPSAVTTASPTALLAQCTRSCPVTSEYNPVCGSNNVTYTNPGRLECAKNCGVYVTIQRLSSCSVPAQSSPPPPFVPPQTPPPPFVPPQTPPPAFVPPWTPPSSQQPPPFIPVSELPVEEPFPEPKPTPSPVGPSNPGQNNGPFTISPELLASLFTTEDPDDPKEDIDERIPDEK